MGCCFHFLVFSSNMGFIAHRLYAYKRIFQVSRERENRMRKFFIDMFTSYSLFFPIWHCSIYLYVWVLFFDCIYAVSNWFWLCWFPCFLVRYVFGFFLIFNFYLWFHLLSIIGIWFPFHCIFQWVIFLFSFFHWISVSLPSIYERITGFSRYLGTKSNLGGSTSSISLLRIPCSLLYRIAR